MRADFSPLPRPIAHLFFVAASVLQELLRQRQPEQRRDIDEVLGLHGLLRAARGLHAHVDVRGLLHAVHQAERGVKALAGGEGAVERPDRHVVPIVFSTKSPAACP